MIKEAAKPRLIKRFKDAESLLALLIEGFERAIVEEDEESYSRLRENLISDPQLGSALPQTIQDSATLSQFLSSVPWDHFEHHQRATWIEAQFQLIFDEIYSRIDAVSDEDMNVDPVMLLDGGPMSDNLGPSASASDWTGRFTVKERAAVVLELAPAAIEGVRALLVENERRLHNKPPEALEAGGLAALRELHTALDSLIEAIEAGKDPVAGLEQIRSLFGLAFTFASDTGQILVGGLKPLLASVPTAWGSWLLLGSICDPVNFALLGPGVATAIVGGTYAVNVSSKRAGAEAQ
jgi:hypothetical protein